MMQMSAPVSTAVGDGPMGDARRIAPSRAGDDLGAKPIGPYLQLLDRGGAKRVAGAQHHALSLGREILRQFGDRRRFPRSVHARHHDHRRSIGRNADRRGILRHQFLQLPPDDVDHVGHLHDASAEIGGDLIRNLLRGGRAYVGLEENSPQLFEKHIIHQPAFFLEQVADVGEKKLVSFFQPLLEPAEDATRLARLIGLRRGSRRLLGLFRRHSCRGTLLLEFIENAHRASPPCRS